MSATDATHHVGEIIGLLEAATGWTPITDPEVKSYWEDNQNERGPGADQPAILYVWSPTDSTLESFSMDGTEFLENNTVEVQVWSLDEQEARQLQGDVTRILSGYLDDNTVRTPYSDVHPTGQSDFREQNPARQSSHYVMGVEVETTGLSDTDK